ncbi:L,D-transpeptidase [Paenibacillus larvae]|uniref:L,D-transpeptidase n=3 Tax=Paenibacillus larvae TaxID=1464 RepID=A0AAP5N1U9_9BACL|nr:L,D-transpeptidase [Paenibacillus larvae]AHD07396.1 putative metal uptake system lipoprotein [Paenibacillus larvae subsp. larvae DSM 25430]AQT85486.1 L,D-transpeptidase [Paenibacillus larvae subsp. pulvifaciens]AQZ47496.1 L,D-transpeptidase [Paenibacillus larvae subsp. pulvifaciens]AVF23737.1 putative metal uptake system lipoprotein [Paenibacillus larvae subsp. larvae]AVF24851.1 putative metal uptake system lipoprotein [Paenibacillus larvae subsp. larvae]
MKHTRRIVLLMIAALLPVSLMAACSQSIYKTEKASSEKSKSIEKTETLSTETPKNVRTKTEKKEIDWTKPSGGEYPDIKNKDSIWIDVSTQKQEAYIKNGSKIIYTMLISSGLDQTKGNSTPKGTYYVEPERGEWFFSQRYQEGGEYWVSWKNHGEFLFHSVPMTKDKKVIEKEAKKLGTKASHGCIRLAIPDAKWIYENIPKKTKVVIS